MLEGTVIKAYRHWKLLLTCAGATHYDMVHVFFLPLQHDLCTNKIKVNLPGFS